MKYFCLGVRTSSNTSFKIPQDPLANNSAAASNNGSKKPDRSHASSDIMVSLQADSPVLLTILANQTKMMSQLSRLQSTMNSLRVASRPMMNQDQGIVPHFKLIEPAKDLKELEDLEENLSNEEYFAQVLSEMRTICGTSGTSRGINSCYKLVDYFFSRECLVHCSWTGSSRSETEVMKTPFRRFVNIIKCFFTLVRESDSSFTEMECEEFFKRILRNSKRRTTCLGLRASTSKQRGKKIDWNLKKELIKSVSGNYNDEDTDVMALIALEDENNEDCDMRDNVDVE